MTVLLLLAFLVVRFLLLGMARTASGIVDFAEGDGCAASSAIDDDVSFFFGKQGIV